jgi:hypothetical protein
MNYLKVFLSVILVSCVLFLNSQETKVKINIGANFQPLQVSWYLYNKSEKEILYVYEENKFRIDVEGIKTRDLKIQVVGDSLIQLKEIWRPIQINKYWYEAFAEYTLNTAKNYKAYNPDLLIEDDVFVDNGKIYWEKEFSINPPYATEIVLDLYKKEHDTLVYIGRCSIYANYR